MMLGALFKKQLLEMNTWLIQDKKSGKKRSAAGMVLFILLYAAVLVTIGATFYYMSDMLCAPLVAAGFGWLYFAVMGLVTIALGVFGCVFNTYAMLYRAKDNELLLSLPIPPSRILAVRLFGVWMWSFVYELPVLVPALAVYWTTASPGAAAILLGILLLLVLSVFILTLSCVLGWVVARLSVRLKNKSMITVVLSLLFIALYYYFYIKAYSLLQSIVANAGMIGARIRGAAYPFYLMGRMGEGDALSAMLFTLIIAALFALVCFVLAHSFLRMATAPDAGKKAVYREKSGKVRGVGTALLFKEAKRFTSSPVYMLNCGLGTVILPIFGVFALVRADWLRSVTDVLAGYGSPSLVPLVACAGVCMMSSMNDMTAPSVSLEGKNLWLVQSLPVSPWQVLRAKLGLHLLLTEPAAVFCSACIAAALHLTAAETAAVIAVPMLFVLLGASFGLAVNLKRPNLGWRNEIVPVKQSMSVFLSLFGGWGVVTALGVLYYELRDIVPAVIYLAGCAALFAALALALLAWLRTRGARIFAGL